MSLSLWIDIETTGAGQAARTASRHGSFLSIYQGWEAMLFTTFALDFVQLRFSPWASWVYGPQGNNFWPPWNEYISIHIFIFQLSRQLALRLPVATAKCRRRTKLQHVHLGHPEDHLRLKEVVCVHAANLTTSTHTNLISIVINMQMSSIVKLSTHEFWISTWIPDTAHDL